MKINSILGIKNNNSYNVNFKAKDNDNDDEYVYVPLIWEDPEDTFERLNKPLSESNNSESLKDRRPKFKKLTHNTDRLVNSITLVDIEKVPRPTVKPPKISENKEFPVEEIIKQTRDVFSKDKLETEERPSNPVKKNIENGGDLFAGSSPIVPDDAFRRYTMIDILVNGNDEYDNYDEDENTIDDDYETYDW